MIYDEQSLSIRFLRKLSEFMEFVKGKCVILRYKQGQYCLVASQVPVVQWCLCSKKHYSWSHLSPYFCSLRLRGIHNESEGGQDGKLYISMSDTSCPFSLLFDEIPASRVYRVYLHLSKAHIFTAIFKKTF